MMRSAAVAACIAFANGCRSGGSGDVAMPSVNPSAAAQQAIALFDKDGDGRLDQTELAASPGLSSARERYDTDADRKVSEEEIRQRLEQMYSAGAGLLEVRCAVRRAGRPLANATVRFVPEPFLGDAILSAAATTDSNGVAAPSLPADQLPENLRSAQLMQVGLYRVEIEHPTISPSSSKALGFEVDPTSRDGTVAQFNL
jgi:hypothetical protein